jgi:hypothetical protein
MPEFQIRSVLGVEVGLSLVLHMLSLQVVGCCPVSLGVRLCPLTFRTAR